MNSKDHNTSRPTKRMFLLHKNGNLTEYRLVNELISNELNKLNKVLNNLRSSHNYSSMKRIHDELVPIGPDTTFNERVFTFNPNSKLFIKIKLDKLVDYEYYEDIRFIYVNHSFSRVDTNSIYLRGRINDRLELISLDFDDSNVRERLSRAIIFKLNKLETFKNL